MSLSFPKYHDIHPISHVLLDYLDNQKARDCVLSLIKSEYSVIRSLLQMDVDGVTKLTTQVIRAYLSRYGDWTDIHLKRRYAQDLAKRSISKFYDGLVAPSSLTISLLLNTKRAEKGRHGDLSFIIKLARGLASWGARINIATNETEKAKTLLKGIGCNVLNIADKQTSSCLLKSDLVIEAPVFRISLCQIRKKLKENGRLIQIREYSCSAINQMREARQVTQAIVEKILPKLSAFGGFQ